MTRRQYGLAASVAGVAAFFAGIYGLMGELSIFVSGAGVLMLLIGLVIVLLTTKRETLSTPDPVVIVVAAVGIALHLYENLFKIPGNFSFGWLLWPLTPYALCLIVSSFPATRVAAVAGVVVALLFDLVAHYDVFVNPKSSTAALALVFVPLWNTLVFSPGAIFVAWLFLRRRGRQAQPAP